MSTKGLGIRLSLAAFLVLSPIAIPSAHAQDCVRIVRSISNFSLQGDAWMWWDRASGHYARDRAPSAGSVLVFKRTGRLNRGHVSLVSRIIDRRTVEVDHSWLDGRGLRRGMRVVDVSAGNDWSMVRVWHEPSGQMGLRVYPTYGFILPDGARPRTPDAELRYAVAPPGRGGARTATVETARAPAPVLPAHKPMLASAAPDRPAATMANMVLPPRKPSRGTIVAAADGTPCPLPGRKPGEVVAQVASTSN